MANNWHQQLLTQLRSLYSKLIHRILKNREESFSASAFAGGQDSVLPGLNRYLESAAHVAGEKETTNPAAVFKGTSEPWRPVTTVNRIRSALAEHFRKKRPATRLRPRISLDLERETWKHIHQAMRYAGEGDLNNARLHGQIAVEALHELSHYLPEEHYERFREEVLQRLDEMYQSIETSVIKGAASDGDAI